MAITNVRTVQRCEVYPLQDSSAADTTNAKHESVMVVYNNTFDDSNEIRSCTTLWSIRKKGHPGLYIGST